MPACKQVGERGAVTQGVEQRSLYGCVRVGQRGQGFGGVDDPAAVGGQAFQPEPLAVPHEHGGSGAVYFEDEPGTGHE